VALRFSPTQPTPAYSTPSLLTSSLSSNHPSSFPSLLSRFCVPLQSVNLFQLLLNLHHRHACCRHLQPSVALVSFLTRSLRPHSYIRCANNSGSSKLNIALFLIRPAYESPRGHTHTHTHTNISQPGTDSLVLSSIVLHPVAATLFYPRSFFCRYQEDHPFIDGAFLSSLQNVNPHGDQNPKKLLFQPSPNDHWTHHILKPISHLTIAPCVRREQAVPYSLISRHPATAIPTYHTCPEFIGYKIPVLGE